MELQRTGPFPPDSLFSSRRPENYVMENKYFHWPTLLAGLVAAATLSACGGGSTTGGTLPQLSAATPAVLQSCDSLAGNLALPDTRITSSERVAAGPFTDRGVTFSLPAHCLVKGKMKERTSTVDGASYAIGFEIRLPQDWNGRFLYQANGGLDGSVLTALGNTSGAAPTAPALAQGFAVLSSDAGHGSPTPFFGLDPQARLDYGYQAVGTLTPMAKNLIKSAYGKAPDRSYLAGCSNGGRHAMVAASRYADQYDGILAGNPGTRLPLAAIANIAGAKAYNALATTAGNPSTGFTQAERTLVSQAVLAKCDALDGTTDGMVQDGRACQAAFDLARDVPTCSGTRDGTCLSAEQKTGIAALFKGATTSQGQRIYSSFPWDSGLDKSNWATWKFSSSLQLDTGAVAFVWQTPPENPNGFNGPGFALNGNVDDMLARIQASNATYTESALSFMLPPDYGHLPTLRGRGAKLMVYHGTSDPIFSSDDSLAWYEKLQSNHADASSFARLYMIPGMNHCSGGAATDQFDMLAPLVAWVEQGKAPDSVMANARGPGANVPNTELPADWSAHRTRPLCAYPKVARYNGSGDVESASSFSCK